MSKAKEQHDDEVRPGIMGKAGAGFHSAITERFLAHSGSWLGNLSTRRLSVGCRRSRSDSTGAGVAAAGGRTSARQRNNAVTATDTMCGGVSRRIQEISSGSNMADSKPLQAAVALCSTLVTLGQILADIRTRDSTAVLNRREKELSGIVALCDVVTHGVLDRCEDCGEPHEGLDALEHLVQRAKDLAVAAEPTKKHFTLPKVPRQGSAGDSIRHIRKELTKFAKSYGLATSEEEYRRSRVLAGRVKIPPRTPRLQDWYLQREEAVVGVCKRLGVGSKGTSIVTSEPRIVGLAGQSGCGKSTIVSMVISREDVRTRFYDGIVWLQVGQGAKECLPKIMFRLAIMVHETVLNGSGPPPRAPGVGDGPGDGAAYIRRVAFEEAGRQFLVVADDVWEAEVLEELDRARVWVVYTTIRGRKRLPFGDAPLRIEGLQKEEAEMALRRAAELDDDVKLPSTAVELIRLCRSVVLDLVFVGRWGLVRGSTDAEAWGTALDIVFSQNSTGGDGWTRQRWRKAVLRAGLAALGRENERCKELYLCLAVVPPRLVFSVVDAVALLYDESRSTRAFQETTNILMTLEQWGILTLDEGGKYRVHAAHAEIIGEMFANFPVTRKRALDRWRNHISTAAAILSWPLEALVDIWSHISLLEPKDGCTPTAFDTTLQSIDAADEKYPLVLRRMADFHLISRDLEQAHKAYAQLLAVTEKKLGADHVQVAAQLHSVGFCLSELGRVEEAQKMYARALTIREKLDVHDPELARTLYALAECFSGAGRIEQSERLLHRALSIWQECHNANHPDFALTVQRLGTIALRTGRTVEAEGLTRRALALWESSVGPRHPFVACTLHQLGVCAFDMGQINKAEEFYRQALVIREKELGANHPCVATTLHNLGVCAWKAGRVDDAEECYRRTLTIRLKMLGEDHLLVARTRHSLGGCARQAGRASEAEQLYYQALATQEKHLGYVHPEVADTLHELGVCAFGTGRVSDARSFFRRALAIKENRLGPSHRNVGYTLQDLGGCELALGHTTEAETLFRRALDIQEKLDLPLDGAVTLQCLGDCARKASRSERAEAFYREALAIREEKLGEDHLHVGHTLNELGNFILNNGRSEEAGALLRRSLTIREDKLGADHIDVARTLHGLAECARTAGRHEEAADMLGRVLKVEKKLGNKDAEVARTLHKIGVCLLNAGRLNKAMEFLFQALAIEEKGDGHHLDVALTLHQLGVCQSNEGQTEDAEALFQCVLTIEEKKLGPSHPDLADTLHNLGECLLNSGRISEAEDIYRRALTIEENSLGAEQPAVTATLHCLGKCAAQEGRISEAHGLYRRALEMEEKMLGVNHPHIATTLHRLGVCAEKMGNMEEAETLHRRALVIWENEPSEDEADVATTLNFVGKCAFGVGHFEEATELYRRALAIEEKTIGADALGVTTTLHGLGACALNAGEVAEAEGLYRRALAIEEADLGCSSPNVAATLNSLGDCAANAGRMNEASSLYHRSLEIEETIKGDRHVDVAGTLLNLGLCALNEGRKEEAKSFYRRALTIEEENLGAEHPDVKVTAHCLEMFSTDS